MIVSLWMAFFAALKTISMRARAGDTPAIKDGSEKETRVCSVGDEQVCGFLRRLMGMWTDLWTRLRSQPRGGPQAQPKAASEALLKAPRAGSPPPSSRPSSPSAQDDVEGEQVMEGMIHYFRWSKTRVHRVSSIPGGEMLEQAENSASQALLHEALDSAMDETANAAMDTEPQSDRPRKD